MMLVFYSYVVPIYMNRAISLNENAIDIMYVVCGKEQVGKNAKQAITLAILFSYSKLYIHLIVENETQPVFQSMVILSVFYCIINITQI